MEITATIQWIDSSETEEVLFKVGGQGQEDWLDEQYFFYLEHPDEIFSEFTDFTVIESDYESLLAALKEEFEEGEQNRFRNNNSQSFEDWLNDKIDND